MYTITRTTLHGVCAIRFGSYSQNFIHSHTDWLW